MNKLIEKTLRFFGYTFVDVDNAVYLWEIVTDTQHKIVEVDANSQMVTPYLRENKTDSVPMTASDFISFMCRTYAPPVKVFAHVLRDSSVMVDTLTFVGSDPIKSENYVYTGRFIPFERPEERYFHTMSISALVERTWRTQKEAEEALSEKYRTL